MKAMRLLKDHARGPTRVVVRATRHPRQAYRGNPHGSAAYS
jgi:hypothetical protein